MPNAAALSSEYVPKRHRPFAVTLTIVCIPLGGSLAGFVGGLILPVYGWRMLFLVGGILPLLLAALLLKVLPESPRYLARRRERWPELRTLLGRLGHGVPADAAFLDGTEKAVSKTSVRELFVPEFRRDTLALCASFFFCLFTVYLGTNWVPSMLAAPAVGFDVGTASYGLTAFNMGGVVGAILGAFVIVQARIAPRDVDDVGRRRRRRAGAVAHGDWTRCDRLDVRDAGVDRRPDERDADHDVRARRARLSDLDPHPRASARPWPSAASAAF